MHSSIVFTQCGILKSISLASSLPLWSIERRPHSTKSAHIFPTRIKRRVIKLADLEELPCERQLQESSNTAGNDNESVRHDHEMVQPGKKVRCSYAWPTNGFTSCSNGSAIRIPTERLRALG